MNKNNADYKQGWDIDKMATWTYQDPPRGAIIPVGGNAPLYPTGTWRSERPDWHLDKCTHCMICWVFCPDDSINVEEEKMTGIDYVHCKGCGICAAECPTDAIDMIPEDASEGVNASA